nr:hypothetical protein [Anaerolineae bacterium]
MKRWIIFLLLALIFAILAFSAPLWLPDLLTFAGTNADTIQSMDSLIQMAFMAFTILAGLYSWLSFRKFKPDGGGNRIEAQQKSIAIGENVSDSTIVIAETMIVAENYWRAVRRTSGTTNLHEVTSSYLEYLLDRHRYLNFKGMG